jgi:DNA modification methylase
MTVKIDCAYDSLVPIEKLVRHPRNNNRHSIEQIEALSKLIKAHGVRHSLVVSNRSGFIVAGHGRLEAALKLGIKELPVDYQDFSSEAEEYQCLTADNEIARWAELDYQNIYDTLKELPDVDVSLLGIEDFKLPEEEIIPQCDEDEVPEATPVPKTKRGDIWLLGNHRLMCGDSTIIDDVEKLMNGEKADMVFTDPPYGYSYESNYQSKHKELRNDDKILDFLPLTPMFMENNAAIYLCTSHQVIEKWKPLICDNFNYKNMIIWKKNNWSMGDLKGSYAGQHEIVIFASKGKVQLEGKRDTDIWEFPRVKPDLHPTMKPVELVEYAITKITCNRVLDLFLGSGTTLIAAEKSNRKCLGMELDEKYCDVIIQRWQKYTGKEAVLESTKQTYNELNENR